MSEWKKQTGINPRTRTRVMERDGYQCVLCWDTYGLQCTHVVPRSRGGKGVETNLVTLCAVCHDRYDFTVRRKQMREEIVDYLTDIYGEWDEEEQIFHKYEQEDF